MSIDEMWAKAREARETRIEDLEKLERDALWGLGREDLRRIVAAGGVKVLLADWLAEGGDA